MIVEGLLYSKEHEWVKIEGQTATIGITDYAQEQLGEITFVELPQTGKELKSHDELGVVESSKAASDVFAPITGKVIEVNSELESSPELINSDSYKAGWICKMEITDSASTKGLMDAKQYDEYLQSL